MRFSDLSASSLPYAARLDGVEKVQGMSSSMRLLGWPSSNARNVAVRYLTGSTSHILQFAIRLASNAQFSAPTSCPAKREFFRLCRGLHNRNYARPLIMCSSLRRCLQVPPCWRLSTQRTAHNSKALKELHQLIWWPIPTGARPDGSQSIKGALLH